MVAEGRERLTETVKDTQRVQFSLFVDLAELVLRWPLCIAVAMRWWAIAQHHYGSKQMQLWRHKVHFVRGNKHHRLLEEQAKMAAMSGCCPQVDDRMLRIIDKDVKPGQDYTRYVGF